MRTTIRIDDELYRQLKVKAAQRGRPVGELIEDAIRASFVARTESAGGTVRLPTFGHDGLMPGLDLTDNAATRDLIDEESPIHARR